MVEEVKLLVEDFGPIKKCDLSLKPLTLLIGRNNTGKSYTTLLIKAVHDIFLPQTVLDVGWGKLLSLRRTVYLRNAELTIFRLLQEAEAIIEKVDARTEAEKAKSALRSFLINTAFPRIQKEISDGLRSELANGIKEKLPRFFGATSVREMVRWGAEFARISLTTQMVSLDVKISKGGDVEFSNFSVNMKRIFDRILQRLERTTTGRELPDLLYDAIHFGIMNSLDSLFSGYINLHYLPASRAGIMLSHRVLAASLVRQAPYLPITGMSLPPLSPANSEFIERLLRISDLDRGHTKSGGRQKIRDIASRLVADTVGGEIVVKPGETGYAEFKYSDDGHEISLVQASSSVGEISPLVLFLKYYVNEKDLLVIEEPEAHLHPAAITQLAKVLARLVNTDVGIILTTHSDYLLYKFSNLIAASKLTERRERISEQETLHPEKCAVYLFRQTGNGTVTQEVPISAEGIVTEEFTQISEEIYDENVRLAYEKG